MASRATSHKITDAKSWFLLSAVQIQTEKIAVAFVVQQKLTATSRADDTFIQEVSIARPSWRDISMECGFIGDEKVLLQHQHL